VILSIFFMPSFLFVIVRGINVPNVCSYLFDLYPNLARIFYGWWPTHLVHKIGKNS
jgi:hypothetical protein